MKNSRFYLLVLSALMMCSFVYADKKIDKVYGKLKRSFSKVEYKNEYGGWFSVQVMNRKGAYNVKGKEVVPCYYWDVSRGKDIYIAIKEGWSVVFDTEGSVIIPSNRYNVIYSSNDTYITVLRGKYAGVCDLDGREIISPNKYTNVYVGSEGVFYVEIGDKVGVCDLDGREIISPTKYTKVYVGSEGVFYVEIGDKAGVCDLDGREIIPPTKYTKVYKGSEGVFYVEIGDKAGVCDSTGKEIIPPLHYTDVCMLDNYIHVKKNGLSGACSLDGKLQVPCEFKSVLFFESDRGFHVSMDGNEYVKYTPGLHLVNVGSGSGDGKAEFDRAIEMSDNLTTDEDRKLYADLIRTSANKGYGWGQTFYGISLKDSNNPAAVEWLKKGAEKNISIAFYNLGLVYEEGNLVRKDPTRAFQYFKKASDLGVPDAMLRVAIVYLEGSNSAKNPVEGMRLLEKAAKHNKRAKAILSLFYSEGSHVQKDGKKAFGLARELADVGNAMGQYLMGRYYESGIGVVKNLKEAVKWYKKSADQKFAMGVEAYERYKKLEELGVDLDYYETFIDR